jgi:glycosyltransferase involved in cell wall biosynthesis
LSLLRHIMLRATANPSAPAISVVIPTYNRAQLVVRAVNSVIAAVRPDDEIIVVDDGSTDNTLGLLRPFGERLRIVQGAHAGAGAARNLGIKVAQHEWVAFLDSDDEWDRDKLELQRPLLNRDDGIAFIFTDFRVQMPNGEIHGEYTREWSQDRRDWSEILGPGKKYSEFASLPSGRNDFTIHEADLYHDLMSRSYLAAFTYIFRKPLDAVLPAFATDTATLEDWQFFGQVARRGKGIFMACETATQHGHSGPRLTDASELTMIESRLVVLRRVWGGDIEFQRARAADYITVLSKLEQRRDFLLGRSLLLKRQVKEARTLLAKAGTVPWKYRALMRMPDFIVGVVAGFLP